MFVGNRFTVPLFRIQVAFTYVEGHEGCETSVGRQLQKDTVARKQSRFLEVPLLRSSSFHDMARAWFACFSWPRDAAASGAKLSDQDAEDKWNSDDAKQDVDKCYGRSGLAVAPKAGRKDGAEHS